MHLPTGQLLAGRPSPSQLPSAPPQLPLGLAPTGDFDHVRERVLRDALDKWDALTPRAAVWLHEGRVWFPEAAQSDFADFLAPTPWAVSQLCQRLGIPAPYFKKCPPRLQDVQFNHWVQHALRDGDEGDADEALSAEEEDGPLVIRRPGGAGKSSSPETKPGTGTGKGPVRALAAAGQGGRPPGRPFRPLRPPRQRLPPGRPRPRAAPRLPRGLVLPHGREPPPAPGGHKDAPPGAARRRPDGRPPCGQQRGGPAGRDGGRAGVPAGLPERADPAGQGKEPAAPAAPVPVRAAVPGGPPGGGPGGAGRGGGVPGAAPGGHAHAGPGRGLGAGGAGEAGGAEQAASWKRWSGP